MPLDKNHNKPYGMTLPISEEIDTIKYRQAGEDFYTKVVRIADGLKDNQEHFEEFKDILRNMRFVPAGRVKTPSVLTVPQLPITALSLVSLKTPWTAS